MSVVLSAILRVMLYLSHTEKYHMEGEYVTVKGALEGSLWAVAQRELSVMQKKILVVTI